MVSLTAPRKLKVCHFKKETEICNYSYSNSILAVKLNRQVCHRRRYYVHVLLILLHLTARLAEASCVPGGESIHP